MIPCEIIAKIPERYIFFPHHTAEMKLSERTGFIYILESLRGAEVEI